MNEQELREAIVNCKEPNNLMSTKELLETFNTCIIGTKFSHPNFSEDEYVYVDENRVAHTEDGYECIDEFWEIRKHWTGWYIKEDEDVVKPFDDTAYYPYYLTNYYGEQTVNVTHCKDCKLMKENMTCPYSRKPIKHPESTSCKYGIKK